MSKSSAVSSRRYQIIRIEEIGGLMLLLIFVGLASSLTLVASEQVYLPGIPVLSYRVSVSLGMGIGCPRLRSFEMKSSYFHFALEHLLLNRLRHFVYCATRHSQ